MPTINKGRWGKFRLKENPKRFFSPSEWEKFFNLLHPRNKFHFLFLFSTGMRYNEAKCVLVGDIDWQHKWIEVKKPKGGRLRIRYSHISSEFKRQMSKYIAFNDLKPEDDFGFPTIQGMNKVLKSTCKESGIVDYLDFSIHNIRKTHENFLLVIKKDMHNIQLHMGHRIEVAMAHYISGAIIKDEKEKEMIRKWFGDIFE